MLVSVLVKSLTSASHLSNAERIASIKTARKALDSNDLKEAPLLVGTGGGSLQTTVELTQEAADAGASHAIVILPGRFSS
jgi:dihydrodipicolinate synthase/N-acetylneuraminate lyase